MNLKSLLRFAAISLTLCGLPNLCHAMARVQDGGQWPDSWPEELEPLRENARTIEMAAGNQEDMYEIYFENREQFESLWPVILGLKTPEAPLRLSRVDPERPGTLFSFSRPAVRIYGPPKSASYGPGGGDAKALEKLNEEMLSAPPEKQKELMEEFRVTRRRQEERIQWLHPGPPWPEDIVSENGALPEYVGAKESGGKFRWMPADRGDKDVGFLVRARVEIELVVDGNIIDLNRIPLPENTPILDWRFAE